MSKTITIRIHPDGKIEGETHGIKGKSCMKYIKILEQMLEARTVDSNFTKEYYEESLERSENLQITEKQNK